MRELKFRVWNEYKNKFMQHGLIGISSGAFIDLKTVLFILITTIRLLSNSQVSVIKMVKKFTRTIWSMQSLSIRMVRRIIFIIF